MGCDIHSWVQKKVNDKWIDVDDVIFSEGDGMVFSMRSYSVFGFLSNTRNYSESEFLSNFRGFPCDLDKNYKGISDDCNLHSVGHLYLSELLSFDYYKKFHDKRDDEIISYRDFLGFWFFEDLGLLKQIGEPENVRIIFAYDN